MTISELIKELEKIKAEHGDIPVRYLKGITDCYPDYRDVELCEFITDREEPEIDVNPYADGFVVLSEE